MANFRAQAAALHVAIKARASRAGDNLAAAHRILARCFPKQLAFIHDRARQKAALCSRRAGKTFCVVTNLIWTALTVPKALCVYVNSSKDECRDLVWENPKGGGLVETLEQFGVECRTHDTRMTVYFPNGSRIKLVGIDDRAAMKKLRGPAYDLLIVDESQDVPDLAGMLDDAAGAAMLDYDGTIITIGTPGKILDGFFWQITRDKDPMPGWSVHRWSMRDNVGILGAWERALTKKLENKWKDDNETWQREYLGRWVASASLLVYVLATLPDEGPDSRYYEELPTRPDGQAYQWHHLLGLDIGWSAGSPWAYVVWAFCDEIPCLYEVDSFSESGLNTDAQAALIQGLVDTYDPERVVADTGSGGLKQIVDGDYVGRYSLPVEHAQKRFKDAAITMFNTDQGAGRIRIKKGSPLDREMLVLPWLDKPGKRLEDLRFPNHCCDAGLYSYRESRFYLAQATETGPDPGTPEFATRQIAEQRQRVINSYNPDNHQPKGFYDRFG